MCRCLLLRLCKFQILVAVFNFICLRRPGTIWENKPVDTEVVIIAVLLPAVVKSKEQIVLFKPRAALAVFGRICGLIDIIPDKTALVTRRAFKAVCIFFKITTRIAHGMLVFHHNIRFIRNGRVIGRVHRPVDIDPAVADPALIVDQFLGIKRLNHVNHTVKIPLLRIWRQLVGNVRARFIPKRINNNGRIVLIAHNHAGHTVYHRILITPVIAWEYPPGTAFVLCFGRNPHSTCIVGFHIDLVHNIKSIFIRQFNQIRIWRKMAGTNCIYI